MDRPPNCTAHWARPDSTLRSSRRTRRRRTRTNSDGGPAFGIPLAQPATQIPARLYSPPVTGPGCGSFTEHSMAPDRPHLARDFGYRVPGTLCGIVVVDSPVES